MNEWRTVLKEHHVTIPHPFNMSYHVMITSPSSARFIWAISLVIFMWNYNYYSNINWLKDESVQQLHNVSRFFIYVWFISISEVHRMPHIRIHFCDLRMLCSNRYLSLTQNSLTLLLRHQNVTWENCCLWQSCFIHADFNSLTF